MKKLRTHNQPPIRKLGWLQETLKQLLKDRLDLLSRLYEQQRQGWPVPPGMPEMNPLQHEPFHEQTESPRRNRPRHDTPGALQREESPHRHRTNPAESQRQREWPPVPPWEQEWPDPMQGFDGAADPREREMPRDAREWLLEEWDYEDIPPPRHLLERRENTPRRAPHVPEWPPTAQWDAPRQHSRRIQDWEETPPLDEKKEVERAKVNAVKSGGRRSGKRRRNKR